MKKYISFLICLFILTTSAFAAEEQKVNWYESYVTADGTRLTRDFNFGLLDELRPLPGNSTFENFEFLRSELPDELPVFAPYQPWEIDSSKTKLFVSPNGKDSNDGSIDTPLLTPQRAVERVNNMQNKQGGVTVYFREGIYSVPEGMKLSGQSGGNNETPVFYSSYNGENVTFTGGIAINGSEMNPLNDEIGSRKIPLLAKPHIYSVDLKKLGYTEFGSFSQSLRPELYIDGVKYTIARWPNAANTGMAQYTESDGNSGVISSGDIIIAGGTEIGRYTGETGNGIEFKVSDQRPFSWENTDNIWMYGYWHAEWQKLHVRAKSFNPALSSVKSYNHILYGARYINTKSFYYYNILEELDIPGEWFLDNKSGMLYIYPISDISASKLQITTSPNPVINITDTKNAVINGINLSVGGSHGVNIQNGRYNIVQNCEISNMAGKAVEATGLNIGIICNKAFNEISVTVPDTFDLNPDWFSRNFVQNNYVIDSMLRVGGGLQGIVSHNVVNGSSEMGIYVSRALETIVEYNEIVAGPDVNLDAGLIYINGVSFHRGDHIRYNYLNRATPEIRNSPYCMYLDDMASSIFVYGNILREGRFFLHGGSDDVVYNNMVIDNYSGRNSMVNSNNYSIKAQRWGGWVLDDTSTRYSRDKSRSYFKDSWMARYPSDYEYHSGLVTHKYQYESSDYDIENDPLGTYLSAPKNNYYGYNLFVNSPFSPYDTSREILSVYENNIVSEKDPGFVDYEGGIYDFKDENILKKLNPGMEPLPKQSKMGVIIDKMLMPQMLFMDEIKPVAPVNTLDVGVLNTRLTLVWTSANGQSVYTVEVSDDKDFENIVHKTQVQSESCVLPELEFGKTYYWRVSADTWTYKIDGKTVEMPAATFRTYSYDEAAEHIELETYEQEGFLNDLQLLLDTEGFITTDNGSDIGKTVYKEDAKEALQKLITSAREKIKTTKLQSELEKYFTEFKTEYYNTWGKYAIPYTKEIGYNDLSNLENWRISNDKIKLTHKEDKNIIRTEYAGGQAMIMNKTFMLHPNMTVKVRMKYDKILEWTTVQLRQTDLVSATSTGSDGYTVVMKPDLIELQKFPRDPGRVNTIVEEIVNDKKIVKDNEWFDFEYTMNFTEEGLNIKVSINGEQLFDWVDENNPIYSAGYFGFMHNSGNGGLEIAPYGGKYETEN